MKGRTWCIEFLDVATKDGDVQVKYKVTGADGKPRDINGVWEGYKKGDSPDKKASRFFNALNSPPYNRLVNVVRAGKTVCFQLKDNAPYQDINGFEVGDQSGQTFNIYDDKPDNNEAPAGEFLETVRFRLDGIPASAGGMVRLGLGQVAPMAQVATHKKGEPLAIACILQELVSVFNHIYQGLGFEASIEHDTVVIPKVPCTLGARGGSDDSGLNYWLSMLDPGLPQFPRMFDKPGTLQDSIRLINARLDLAGISDVTFTDADLLCFAPEDPAPVLKNRCETAMKITGFPGRIKAGIKSIDLKITYTAQLAGTPPTAVTDPVINIVVERIDNALGKVVDQKLTSVAITSPAKGKQITATANCDMNLALGNGVRITATLVSNECPAVTDGPKLASVN
ncbi:hypothetical protein SG34_030765 [Thalassomonas viridans]|uniref:Uncharacterized protein n=1 Tax=Thalassomonas viridans TaxID=137584 RepID=A0AAF0CE08_9GAMM|nr:hypothetical protein [Thalassomonas viridans]WDE09151.1 hypothetical protein SG34_030765 [Thalassomonas viridans]